MYFIDTGLSNVIAKEFDVESNGKVFENYVFSELLKLGIKPKYWRTKGNAEVDFVIEKEKEIISIEVKLKADSEKIERSLRSFIQQYHPKIALVVTYKGKQGSIKVDDCIVHFIDIVGLKKYLT